MGMLCGGSDEISGTTFSMWVGDWRVHGVGGQFSSGVGWVMVVGNGAGGSGGVGWIVGWSVK